MGSLTLAALVAAPLLLLLSSTPAAQSTKLSAPFAPGEVSGDVLDYRVSPDGLHVVYRADQDFDGILELYGRAADGSGSPTKLNAPLQDGASIQDFELSPDGTRVLYRGSAGTAGVNPHVGLFSAPSNGSSAAVELDGPSGLNQDVGRYVLSSDGTQVVFRQGFFASQSYQLFRVPSDGSTSAVAISGSLSASDPVLSPDGTWTVFGTVGQDLYSVPTDGGTSPIRLNAAEPLAGRALVSSDGTRVPSSSTRPSSRAERSTLW